MLAVSLARQSQKNEDQDDSVSLAFQHRIAAEEAIRRSDEIIREFSDLDVPGDRRSSRKRTGLAEMIAFLKTTPNVRRVYVYNVSRLARETFFVLELVREMRALNPPVELRSASENIEDPTILTIISAMAERERIQLSNNVAYSVREQANRGLVTQQPPLGYSRKDGILYPDTDAETVRRIFREYTGGLSTIQIADGLMRDGIRTPYGRGEWRSKGLRRILSCRTYIGEIEISETRDPAGRIRPHVLTKGLHEPLIDRATWELAQQLLESRAWVRRKDGRVEPWFAGAVVCLQCGRRIYLGVKSRKTTDGEPRWYAKCATAQLASDNRTTNTCPGQPSCDLHLIEPAARFELWRCLQHVLAADKAHARAVAVTSVTSEQTRRQLEVTIEKHKDRSAALLESRMNREIGPDEFVRAREIEESAIARLQLELASLPVAPPIAAFRAAHAVIADAAHAIRSWDDDDLRRLVKTVGAQAQLDLGAKTACWTFRSPYDALLS